MREKRLVADPRGAAAQPGRFGHGRFGHGRGTDAPSAAGRLATFFCRGMWTHRAALPRALLRAACQAYGRPAVALRRDFAGVEINRIRDHRPFYSDYEDIALLDALIPTAFDIDPFSGAHRPARAR